MLHFISVVVYSICVTTGVHLCAKCPYLFANSETTMIVIYIYFYYYYFIFIIFIF